MPRKKKTMTSGKTVMVQSVQRTRSRRMKFCVQGGLGGYPQQAAPGAEWLSRGIACRFPAGIKTASSEIEKFRSLAYFVSSFLESSLSSSANPRVWCKRVSRISGGQFI